MRRCEFHRDHGGLKERFASIACRHAPGPTDSLARRSRAIVASQSSGLPATWLPCACAMKPSCEAFNWSVAGGRWPRSAANAKYGRRDYLRVFGRHRIGLRRPRPNVETAASSADVEPLLSRVIETSGSIELLGFPTRAFGSAISARATATPIAARRGQGFFRKQPATDTPEVRR
jgi:hypothetical protein